MALCRRYGLDPYRYKRKRRTTVMFRLPQSFCNEVLWPEFEALERELRGYLNSMTSKLIKDEIFADTSEAAEVDVARLSAGCSGNFGQPGFRIDAAQFCRFNQRGKDRPTLASCISITEECFFPR